VRATGVSLTIAIVAFSYSPARAQTTDFGKRIYHDKAVCSYCHGWAGDGAGEGQSSGGAADLRKTPLTRAQLIEVIKCGIPGRAMPHFDEAAYTDKRCYNSTEADLGANTPPLPPGSVLTQREIEGLVDYLQAKVIGRGPITREECFETLGERMRSCANYPAR
jgi:mono/diheme cytochrome c family protein